MKLTYERDISHNYMVPLPEEEMAAEEYQIQMLTENEISGLLSCRMKRINGKISYYYDITSLQPMSAVYENSPMTTTDLRMFLEGFREALHETERFLLDPDHLMLEPEMIYMDIEDKKPLFCYLPSVKTPVRESFGVLSGVFLEHLEQNDSTAVVMGYQLYRKTREENYSVGTLLTEILFHFEGGAEKPERKDGTDYEIQKSDGTDFRKESGFFADYEERKNSVFGNESIEAETGGAAGYRENAFEESGRERFLKKRDAKRKETEEVEINGTEAERKETSGKSLSGWKLVLCLLTVLSTGIVMVCAWIFHLNITQLGGITFLLTAALCYGFSLETEEKKKKSSGERQIEEEKKADRRSRRKIERENRQMKRASEKDVFRRNAGENGGIERNSFFSGEDEERNREEDYGELFPGELAGTEKRSRKRGDSEADAPAGFSERKADNRFRDNLQRYRSEDVRMDDFGNNREISAVGKRNGFGSTVVSRNGSGTYVPALALISMNPKERNSIVLQKDCYTIGKLKSRSDICIEDPSISRMHARLEREGRAFYLRDLNSTNGTTVNGRRLKVNERCPLQEGDEIRFAGLGYYVGRC